MMKVGIVFAAALFALSVQATVRPVWEDPDQEGKGAEIRMLEDGSRIRVDRIAPEMVRVRRTKGKVWTESGMNRYGIIHLRRADISWNRVADSSLRNNLYCFCSCIFPILYVICCIFSCHCCFLGYIVHKVVNMKHVSTGQPSSDVRL